jgi:GWxTD domain-containing protein
MRPDLERPFAPRVPLLAALICALPLLVASCGGAAAEPGAAPGIARDTRNISFDPTPLYRQMGLIARGLPFPITGRVGYFASPTPARTHVALTLSFASASLTFAREADNRFRANYTVSLALDNVTGRVHAVESTEAVVVSSFRETSRTDESVLFQQFVDLAPGRYRMTLAIRDVGSQRSVQEVVELEVPSFDGRGLSTPTPVNQVRPREDRTTLPDVLVRPRATAVFGRDSAVAMYVESYGPSDSVLLMLARNESGRVLWSHQVSIEPRQGMSSGVIDVPVGRLGIGVSQLSFVREAAADTVSAFLFVGFGDDLPVARFDDMLHFLRHFATQSRLQTLRDAAEEDRPTAWATFLRETDSSPNTPTNEDLMNYFTRLVRANNRFREESSAGWMSERGRVFIVLGEPDQILEPTSNDFQRMRQQLWDYRDKGLQLTFYDQTGTGRWRLTQTSAVRFEAEYRQQLR